jgi:hypothetical protein
MTVSRRTLRANSPPANIFDAEARTWPLQLKFDGACSPGGGGASTQQGEAYFSVLIQDRNPHSIKFEIKSAPCGTTCAYMVGNLRSFVGSRFALLTSGAPLQSRH